MAMSTEDLEQRVRSLRNKKDRKDKKNNGSVHRAYDEIVSDNARGHVDKLVQEENMTLAQQSKDLEWVLAGIDIEWKYYGPWEPRKMRSIKVYLKTQTKAHVTSQAKPKLPVNVHDINEPITAPKPKDGQGKQPGGGGGGGLGQGGFPGGALHGGGHGGGLPLPPPPPPPPMLNPDQPPVQILTPGHHGGGNRHMMDDDVMGGHRPHMNRNRRPDIHDPRVLRNQKSKTKMLKGHEELDSDSDSLSESFDEIDFSEGEDFERIPRRSSLKKHKNKKDRRRRLSSGSHSYPKPPMGSNYDRKASPQPVQVFVNANPLVNRRRSLDAGPLEFQRDSRAKVDKWMHQPQPMIRSGSNHSSDSSLYDGGSSIFSRAGNSDFTSLSSSPPPLPKARGGRLDMYAHFANKGSIHNPHNDGRYRRGAGPVYRPHEPRRTHSDYPHHPAHHHQHRGRGSRHYHDQDYFDGYVSDMPGLPYAQRPPLVDRHGSPHKSGYSHVHAPRLIDANDPAYGYISDGMDSYNSLDSGDIRRHDAARMEHMREHRRLSASGRHDKDTWKYDNSHLPFPMQDGPPRVPLRRNPLNYRRNSTLGF